MSASVPQEAEWVLRVQRLCVAALEGPLSQACEHVDEAFVVVDRDGDEAHPVFAQLLCTAGDAALALGQLDSADALYRRAEHLATWLEAEVLRARALAGSGTVDVHRERPDRARLRLAEALDVLRDSTDDEALAARVWLEAELRHLDTPEDLRLVGCGACIRVAPNAHVVREPASQSLYAEQAGTDGVHAAAVCVDAGRIVRIAESQEGSGTLRLSGTGPRGGAWTVDARGFRCAWPDGTTLRAHVGAHSSFDLATEHGGCLVVRGPFERDDFPDLARLRTPKQRVVGEGTDARGTFIELEYTHDDRTWRQRHARIDDVLCMLVTAQAPLEHFESCAAAMRVVVESLHCA